MIARPDGALLQMPVDLLKGSPFSNYLVPGLLLLTLLGVYPLVVAWAVWRLPGWNWPERLNPFETRHWSWAAALSAGCILVIWISVQLKFLGYLHWVQIAFFTRRSRLSRRGKNAVSAKTRSAAASLTRTSE